MIYIIKRVKVYCYLKYSGNQNLGFFPTDKNTLTKVLVVTLEILAFVAQIIQVLFYVLREMYKISTEHGIFACVETNIIKVKKVHFI